MGLGNGLKVLEVGSQFRYKVRSRGNGRINSGSKRPEAAIQQRKTNKQEAETVERADEEAMRNGRELLPSLNLHNTFSFIIITDC